MRLVSLTPSNTDIVLSLGREKDLVGVDRWSLEDRYLGPHLQHCANVGGDLTVDVEKVAALKPDLVLASLSVPGMERGVAKLQEMGLPYVVVESHTLDGVRKGIRQVAQALSLEEKGEEVVARLDEDLREAREEALRAREARAQKGIPLPQKAAWEWWPKPIIVAGRPSWIHEMLELLGLEPVFSDLEKESSPVEAEEVVRRQPDTYFVCWCGSGERRMKVKDIASRPGWEELPLVRERRIFLLPERYYGRPGPLLGQGMRYLARFLYGRDREAYEAWAREEARLERDAFVYG
ncbi:MAG: ABC transporter substrate-binding protein [Clostridiales bacterium]|nr:ABC transporter substrate-binding protein [Clostridiales bacterium]